MNSSPPAPPKPKWNTAAVIYNSTISAGVVLIGVGTTARFGWPTGAICFGLLLIVLTLVATLLMRPRGPPQ